MSDRRIHRMRAILAGTVNEQAIEKLEALMEELRERALQENQEPGDALTLHLEELPD